MPLNVQRVDYRNPRDAQALCELLNMYAQDPMGGGEPIAPQAVARLCSDLAAKPFAFSFIAWQSGAQGGEQFDGAVCASTDKPVGLINCFEAYSTFKALPLINIHDIAVAPSARGQGVGQALLQAGQLAQHIATIPLWGSITLEETARVLDTSVPTVVRAWQVARLWLQRELG